MRLEASSSFDNGREAVGPVVAVEGEQPHALALALNDQPVAVVLDFVDPFRPVGTLVPRVGMQGSNADLRMGKDGKQTAECESPR